MEEMYPCGTGYRFILSSTIRPHARREGAWCTFVLCVAVSCALEGRNHESGVMCVQMWSSVMRYHHFMVRYPYNVFFHNADFR